MRIFRTGLIVVFAAFLLPAAGLARQPCPTYFSLLDGLVEESAAWELSPADLARIDELFANPALSPAEKATEIFSVSLEARLKDVPEHEASDIRRIAREAKRRHTRSRFEGEYNVTKRRLRTSTPRAYRDTVLEYYMLGHEVEHAIQHARLSKHIGSIRQFYYRVFHFRDQRFRKELGSMQSEVKHVKAFPKEMRDELAAAVRGSRTVKKAQKEEFLEILNGPELTLEDYIKQQHEKGRYSLQELDRLEWAIGGAVLTPFIISATALFTYYQVKHSVCEAPVERTRLLRDWCGK